MSATLPLFVVAVRQPSDNAGVGRDADQQMEEGDTKMIDLYRTEMTARYSVQENHEWAARERLARQARTAKAKTQRPTRIEAPFGGLLSRLARAYAQAI